MTHYDEREYASMLTSIIISLPYDVDESTAIRPNLPKKMIAQILRQSIECPVYR